MRKIFVPSYSVEMKSRTKKNTLHSRMMAVKREQRANKSRSELRVFAALRSLDIPFQYQRGFLCGGYAVAVVDFFLPTPQVVLEVDGPEHDPIKDALRENKILLSVPMAKFLRIKNSEVWENRYRLPAFIAGKLERVNEGTRRRADDKSSERPLPSTRERLSPASK